MNRICSSSGACCLPQVEGVTYLQVGPNKIIIGMMDLETVFQQLRALGRQPDETTDAELVDMARKFNYIPESAPVEANYAIALREAYAHFCVREAKDERQM